MFPQTDGLGDFCFSGSNFYAELIGFEYLFGICVEGLNIRRKDTTEIFLIRYISSTDC